jgi:hypothetical protein
LAQNLKKERAEVEEWMQIYIVPQYALMVWFSVKKA